MIVTGLTDQNFGGKLVPWRNFLGGKKWSNTGKLILLQQTGGREQMTLKSACQHLEGKRSILQCNMASEKLICLQLYICSYPNTIQIHLYTMYSYNTQTSLQVLLLQQLVHSLTLCMQRLGPLALGVDDSVAAAIYTVRTLTPPHFPAVGRIQYIDTGQKNLF